MKTAELRKILKLNNVDFPPEAKKKDLVNIFWSASAGIESKSADNTSKDEVKKPTKRTKKRKVSKARKEPIDTNVVDSESEKSGKVEDTSMPAEKSANAAADLKEVEPETQKNSRAPEKAETSTLSVLATPSKNGISLDAPKTSASLRKRKSILEEVGIPHSDSPSKGNIFEIESDDDFPTPQKKRLKSDTSAGSSLQLSQRPKSSFPHRASSKSPTPTTRQVAASEEAHDHIGDGKDHSLELNSDLIVSESDSKEVAETSVPETTTDVTEGKTSELPASKQQQEIDDSRDSNAEVSQEVSSSDNAPSFDKALEKLKKANEPNSEDSPHTQQDEELAKFLGVDIRSVKPKVKGKRVITPRRPIYILKADLSHLSEHQKSLETLKLSDEDLNVDDNTPIDLLQQDDEGQESSSLLDLDTEKTHTSRSSSLFKAISYLVLWLFLVSSVLYTYWLWQQTLLVGYCGHEIDHTTIPKSENYPALLSSFGSYLDRNFKPNCVDCPQHARCFPNLEIACYDDFVPYAPWYYKYAPFIEPKAQRCIPDTKKAEKIEIMIDIALDLLRARNANKLCGGSPKEDLDAGISLHDLHDLLLTLKAPYITIEEFEELWERSIVELEKEPEIIVRQVTIFETELILNNHTNTQVGFKSSQGEPASDVNNTVAEKISTNKILRSTSLSHLSFKCMISNTVVSILIKFKLAVVVLACIGLILFAAFWKYQQSQIESQKIETIYREVLNKLQRQARLARESAELPAYVGSIQLRDLILSSENNLAYKMRLWEGISRKVNRNTNVSSQLLEIHGEVMKVWQWIGTLE